MSGGIFDTNIFDTGIFDHLLVIDGLVAQATAVKPENSGTAIQPRQVATAVKPSTSLIARAPSNKATVVMDYDGNS